VVAAAHRIDQLAPQQAQRRPPVEFDVVERVRGDLGDPHEAGLHILQEEQVDGAKQQAAESNRQPHLAHVLDELGCARVRCEDSEQRGVDPQRCRRQCPDREQHYFALQVVAHLDRLLVLVGRPVDRVVAFRLEAEVADLAAHHREQPADQRRGHRVREDHEVRREKAQRADQVQRLIDAAVVVVPMIVPALCSQGLQKTLHGGQLQEGAT